MLTKKTAAPPRKPHPIERAVVQRDEFGLFAKAFGIVARPAWQSALAAGEHVDCRHLDGTDILGLVPMDEARERFSEAWTIANDSAAIELRTGRWIYTDGDAEAWKTHSDPSRYSKPFTVNCVSVALMSRCFPRMANHGAGYDLAELGRNIEVFWKTRPIAALDLEMAFAQGLELIAARRLRDEPRQSVAAPDAAPPTPAGRL